jgi:hypothetical protein
MKTGTLFRVVTLQALAKAANWVAVYIPEDISTKGSFVLAMRQRMNVMPTVSNKNTNTFWTIRVFI